MSCTNTTAATDGDTVNLAWLGIMLGLLASIGINVGNNMQAVGLQQQTESGSEKQTKTFIVGTVLFAVASVINFGAFGFAPAAILAPLEGVQFISNLCFARFVNKKHVSLRMVSGSALVIVGVVISIMAGPSGVAAFSFDDLICFWTSWGWLLYLSLVITVATTCQGLHVWYQRRLDAGRALPSSATVLPVTFAISAALVGSQAVVQAKSMSELVELVFDPAVGVLGLLGHWFFYFCLVLLFLSGGLWLNRLSAALGKYDPLFIIPMLQSNYILFSTVTGGIFFQEFASLSASGMGVFAVGILIMYGGLYLLKPEKDAAASAKSTKWLADDESCSPTSIKMAPSYDDGTQARASAPGRRNSAELRRANANELQPISPSEPRDGGLSHLTGGSSCSSSFADGALADGADSLERVATWSHHGGAHTSDGIRAKPKRVSLGGAGGLERVERVRAASITTIAEEGTVAWPVYGAVGPYNELVRVSVDAVDFLSGRLSRRESRSASCSSTSHTSTGMAPAGAGRGAGLASSSAGEAPTGGAGVPGGPPVHGKSVGRRASLVTGRI